MQKERKPNGYWDNYERCYEEAKKYKSRGEFAKKSGAAYQFAWSKNWLDEYTWFEPQKKPSCYWNEGTCREEAKKYKSRHEFEINAVSAYDVARKNGWMDEYTWFEIKKKPNGYWTEEICHKEAQKYKSKGEFRKNAAVAYGVAWKNGWLDEYTWFEVRRKPRGYWNRKNTLNEALKYKSITEFIKRCSAGYRNALRNGWLNDYTWFVASRT